MSKIWLRFIYVALLTAAFQHSPIVSAQTEILMSPSLNEIQMLSHLFANTGKPVPIAILYDATGLRAFGIPTSQSIRNGVHARLAVQAGLVKDLAEANSHPSLRGGTLFLEWSDGLPRLGFLNWNSVTSKVTQDQISKIPGSVLQALADATQAEIANASKELREAINAGNSAKYGEDTWRNDKNNAETDRHSIDGTYRPKTKPLSDVPVRARLVRMIELAWQGKDGCRVTKDAFQDLQLASPNTN